MVARFHDLLQMFPGDGYRQILAAVAAALRDCFQGIHAITP